MRKLLALTALALAVGPASAATWMIGDDDGYGVGIPDNANHPFNGFTANHDNRSAGEMAATDGAQFTDTYSTSHPGFGPADQGTVSTFKFTGLTGTWTQGSMWFDMADFQASTFGAVAVTFNGIVQNWAFNDGFPTTKVRFFNLDAATVASINALDELTIVIDRNASSDFYGFDYARLEDVNAPIPEPSTYAMMGLGLGALALAARRRRKA
jgi:hypothetical protein